MSLAVRENEVVSGSSDKTIKIWDRQSGQLLRTLERHSDGVRSVAVMGNDLVSASWDKTIRISGSQSGQDSIHAFRIDGGAMCVATDGDYIAAGDAAGRIHLLRRVNV